MLESLDTSPVQLNDTVESLLGAKPGLVSTPRKPCMQTLETLVISLTDPPIPILFPIMLRIVPSVLQHPPFRRKTPRVLTKLLSAPPVAAEARITRPAAPTTFRVKPLGLDIIYRVDVPLTK